jgi:C4-dicarboxylate-specific signal transduction histidine kinase
MEFSGSIEAEGSPGAGAVFNIRLPVVESLVAEQSAGER